MGDFFDITTSVDVGVEDDGVDVVDEGFGGGLGFGDVVVDGGVGVPTDFLWDGERGGCGV